MPVIPKLPLSAAVFHSLLALAGRERHGYGIMQQAKEDSAGNFKMGPGTLYGTLERMLTRELIEECLGPPGRRKKRYYRITALGRKLLESELERYLNVAKIAQERRLAMRGMSFED